MGLTQTVLFGWIRIPDSREEITRELEQARESFVDCPTRYRQAVIDCLESALDDFRREADV